MYQLVTHKKIPQSGGRACNQPLKTCPYNPNHKVSTGNYDRHKRHCPQKPKIDSTIEKEMKDYIKLMKEQKLKGTENMENVNDLNIEKTEESTENPKCSLVENEKPKKHLMRLRANDIKARKNAQKKIIEMFEKEWEMEDTNEYQIFYS